MMIMMMILLFQVLKQQILAYLGTFFSISPYFRPHRVTSAGPRTAQAVARSGSDGPGAARTQPRQPRSLHRVLRQEEKFGKREREIMRWPVSSGMLGMEDRIRQ